MAIAIMTSGGDCAGMNPAIKQFVDYSFSKKMQPYLIYDGLEGLIDNTIKKACYEDVAGIMHLGGTKIRSSRSKRFFEYKYREQAFKNLQQLGIDKIIVLGGDGSFKALDQFYKDFGISFVGIPSTIDNDIFGTDYCLGVDTALNMIRNATDAIRDTSASFKRACVIETMGRNCGYLALVTAITCGAEVCMIPELEYDLDVIGQRLKEELANGRKYIVCVVSEGCKEDVCTSTQGIVNWLEKDLGIETRATILGHVQRGGNPTVFDRLMASEFATYAVDHLVENEKSNKVIVYKQSQFEFVSIDYINSEKYQIKQELLDLAKRLVN
ncbi:MAG: 6-phosphofructokinase [Arcobacteraceae bacterium]